LEDQFEVANAAHAGDFGTKGVSDLGVPTAPDAPLTKTLRLG
jgi:hypothetical protein